MLKYDEAWWSICDDEWCAVTAVRVQLLQTQKPFAREIPIIPMCNQQGWVKTRAGQNWTVTSTLLKWIWPCLIQSTCHHHQSSRASRGVPKEQPTKARQCRVRAVWGCLKANTWCWGIFDHLWPFVFMPSLASWLMLFFFFVCVCLRVRWIWCGFASSLSDPSRGENKNECAYVKLEGK